MRFAILAVVLLLLLVLAGGAFLFTFRSSPVPIATVKSGSNGVASTDGSLRVSPTSGTAGGVRFTGGTVAAKIWREGKRVLFAVDGSGLEIELGAEDGTFTFEKLRQNLDALDRSFHPAGGALREIALEVGAGVPETVLAQLARVARERGMRGVKVNGAFVAADRED